MLPAQHIWLLGVHRCWPDCLELIAQRRRLEFGVLCKHLQKSFYFAVQLRLLWEYTMKNLIWHLTLRIYGASMETETVHHAQLAVDALLNAEFNYLLHSTNTTKINQSKNLENHLENPCFFFELCKKKEYFLTLCSMYWHLQYVFPKSKARVCQPGVFSDVVITHPFWYQDIYRSRSRDRWNLLLWLASQHWLPVMCRVSSEYIF